MFELKLKFFALIITAFSVAKACHLNVDHPIPLFSKNFGSKNLTFRAKPSGVELSENESIEVYCMSGIMYKRYNGYIGNNGAVIQKKALLQCENGYIYVNRGQYGNMNGDELTVYCSSSFSSNLYESKSTLANCDNFMSYAIGEHIPLVGTAIKAGICYDLERFELKYANYIAYQRNDFWISSEPNLSHELGVDLGIQIGNLKNYFDFMSQLGFNVSRDMMRSDSNQFFNAFEFDYDSILQDDYFHNQLGDFAYIFNTMWWRQLRQNNWRYFLGALKERTYSEKYIIFVGTHGNATMPQKENTDGKPEELTVRSPNLAVTAPKYIWAYVKPVIPNNEEEFVVIATNSPYIETPDHKEFCKQDICDDIAWLKKSRFGQLRRIPTFGYTFCCPVEEVAKIIEHFPVSTEGLEAITAAVPLLPSPA
ncbi:uncharacterized protein LOC105213362 [Zeugodacus cucurbitae]|uniref:uncharacterized protein LOC105213362 n=1 Tax=Zeugodacus cucurbitae TaxID=28588 RepID=UPI0023D9511C|nr:uncharacterized protein LOC105213362 [Zeugodacus cucurbitae]